MATQTAAQKKAAAKKRAAASKAGTSKAATRKGTRKATEKKTEDTVDRKALRAERDEQNTERMLEMREEGSSWSEIGTELGITPGKAQFLNMLHLVAEGEVKAYPKNRLKDEESIAALVKEQRERADQYSSWGWISARSGISEPTLKRIHEEHNSWKPKTENIAIVRAAKNGETTTKKSTGRKTTAGSKDKATATKAAKAKAKARARSKEATPTS